MKILQVMAGGKAGGAEMAFVDMCIAMHEAGEDIEVVTRTNDKQRLELLEAAGVKVHTAMFGGFPDIYTKRKIKRIIKKFEPDIVQTWMARAAWKTPHWTTVKTKKRFYTAARLGGYYDLKYFKNMDYFAAVTPYLKVHIEEGGIDSSRIKQLNNFAETEDDIVPVHRQDFDTPDDATVIVSLARYHHHKALDVLIEAMKDLPSCYLWLAGDGPLREQLETQAKALGVDDRVKFLGWRTDRAALLQAADICSFTSRIEPFGSVFIQAWANKVPVIVSDADGPKQFCTPDKDCLMVQKDNVQDIVSAVKKLQDDNVLSLQLVKEGYQNYTENFTKEKSVQSYLKFYEEILAAA